MNICATLFSKRFQMNEFQTLFQIKTFITFQISATFQTYFNNILNTFIKHFPTIDPENIHRTQFNKTFIGKKNIAFQDRSRKRLIIF